jgi:hypothetical protein
MQISLSHIDEQQLVLRRNIIKARLNATPVIDRYYFHTVYFCEPGGVLFEIAMFAIAPIEALALIRAAFSYRSCASYVC